MPLEQSLPRPILALCMYLKILNSTDHITHGQVLGFMAKYTDSTWPQAAVTYDGADEVILEGGLHFAQDAVQETHSIQARQLAR